MTEDEMRKFIENSKKLKFDIIKAEEANLEDLSREKILELLVKSGKRTKREANIENINFKLMKNLGIADEFKKIQAPTVAGFLIFSKNKPQENINFGRYLIRCVRFKGINVSSEIIDSRDIDGTLDVQIDETQKFILRNIKKSARIVGTKRVEEYEYPEEAIREIVANSVIHRDYKITETYTQVNIFEDRLEIFNPGCLPPGVTVENIKEAQASRNEIIAARLKDLDYLEEYGRGIDIVFSKMKERRLIPPVFKNTANSFKVVLIGKKLNGLNERQITIWNHLVESDRGKITARDCERIIKIASRKTINNDLNKMIDMGLIVSKGESVRRYYECAF